MIKPSSCIPIPCIELAKLARAVFATSTGFFYIFDNILPKLFDQPNIFSDYLF